MFKSSARSGRGVLVTTLALALAVRTAEAQPDAAAETPKSEGSTPVTTQNGEPAKVVELPRRVETPKEAEPVKVQPPEFIARNKKGELVIRDDAAGFGREKQWAFSSDAALSVQEQTTSHATDSRVTSITLAPAADYFVLKNLSLGGVVGVTYQKTQDIKGARITLGPRIGYNFEISRLLSLWPRLGFSYAHTTNSKQNLAAVPGGTSTFNNHTSADAIALSIFIPLMLHPAPHFFAGFGPFMDSDLSGYNRATVLGVKLTLGGWINRDQVEDEQ